MEPLLSEECHKRRLAPVGETVDYEIAVALADTAKLWALLAERLMFAVKKEGLSSLDPSLSEDYRSACLDEPGKYALPTPTSASPSAAVP